MKSKLVSKWYSIGMKTMIAALFFCLLLWYTYIRVGNAVEPGQIVTDPEELKPCRAALVLGTSPTLPDGRSNRYFHARMASAAKLAKAGKAIRLVLSGANPRPEYNEPLEMRKMLLKMDVPARLLICDYGGNRTLDSVSRMKDVFGQREFIIVSQRFHCERAIYQAKKFGLKVTALAAEEDASDITFLRNRAREVLARFRAVIELELLHFQARSPSGK